MTKHIKLKICNMTLMVLTFAAIASGIQLEAISSNGVASVWIHIGVCIAFMALVIYHIYLHFKWRGWISKFRKLKSPVTRILALFWFLTFITGIATVAVWLTHHSHSGLGGWHGKIGFIFIILAICHAVKRISKFKRPASNKNIS